MSEEDKEIFKTPSETVKQYIINNYDKCNSKGIFIGIILAVILTFWQPFGWQYAKTENLAIFMLIIQLLVTYKVTSWQITGYLFGKFLKDGNFDIGGYLYCIEQERVNDEVVRDKALSMIGGLSKTSADAVKALIFIADNNFYNKDTRKNAIGKIAELGYGAKEHVPSLIKLLNNDESYITKKVLMILKKITKQNFGVDEEAWLEWWRNSKKDNE